MQKQRIFLIIGVVLALAGIFMIKVYLDQQRQVTEEAVQKKYERTQASQTPVLFAKKDISPGETINPDDLEIKVTPNQAVQPGAVTSLDRVFGMVVIAPIARGEQVNLSKLSQQRAASDLASATPSGKRAVSITVDDVASLGGMIKPGDYVDVIATVPIPAQTAEGKTVAQAAVMPLFQNVLVLAVGQRVGAPAAEPQIRYRSEAKRTETANLITLALSPQEANLMAFVQEQGKVRLILRSPSDAKVVPVAPASWDALFQYIMPQSASPQGAAAQNAPSQSLGQTQPAGPYVEIYRGLNKEKVPLK